MEYKDLNEHQKVCYQFGIDLKSLCDKYGEDNTLSRPEIIGLLTFCIHELIEQ